MFEPTTQHGKQELERALREQAESKVKEKTVSLPLTDSSNNNIVHTTQGKPLNVTNVVWRDKMPSWLGRIIGYIRVMGGGYVDRLTYNFRQNMCSSCPHMKQKKTAYVGAGVLITMQCTAENHGKEISRNACGCNSTEPRASRDVKNRYNRAGCPVGFFDEGKITSTELKVYELLAEIKKEQ